MKHLKLFEKDVDYQTFISGEIDLPNVSFAIDIEKVYYNPEPEPKKYLTIEALEDGLTASLSINDCEYCIDENGDWKTLSADTPTESINAGQTLSFRGNLTPDSSNGIGTFTISKKCNVLGNIMSMLFGDNAQDSLSLSGKNYAFYELFQGCANIISAKYLYLPATTLAERCYYSMFSDCTGLTTAPELPATTLAIYCYSRMFYRCFALTQAPELPATTLANYCYAGMFESCTGLTTAPTLPVTTLAVGCYSDMFKGCKSLATAPELPATTLTKSCYAGMFRDCSSLTTAPKLPATTLANYCYNYMFTDCSSLTTAPKLPATKLTEKCYQAMFQNCFRLTTAPELPATTLANYCYSQMFINCKSLTTAPELPATTLTKSCYYQMFFFCVKLNHIKMLATNISASNCLNKWVDGVASTGTFVKHPNMTSLPAGINGIPEGWDVQDASL